VRSRADAELELANVLADVRRGLWRPPVPRREVQQPELRAEPSFHEFSSEWLAGREAEGLARKSVVDLRWSLVNHLLPYFAGFRLSEITAQEIDCYKQAKVQERVEIDAAREAALARGERFSERGLANGSINHTLRHLSQVLETAAEYGLIASNPASGKRRRLKAARPARPAPELEQLMALLDAAKRPDGKAGVGRVLLGLLAGGGLRIGEALALRWQHVDLGTGTLHVVQAKTEKGVREVPLPHALREELALWRHDAKHVGSSDFVVHTSTGGRQNPSNLRRGVLVPAVAAANAKLAEDGIAPIEQITFHSLRRTYVTLRLACDDTIHDVADWLGHEDARFTDRVYRQAKGRRARLRGPHLRAFDRAVQWAEMGRNAADELLPSPAEETKTPAVRGL
jgi:integrase